MASRSVFLT